MDTDNSFNVTIEQLFCLAPIEKMEEKDLIHFSFHLNDLQNLKEISKLKKIKENHSYIEAIINENIFSYFLCNESESYLILIDKRPSNLFNSNSFIRYTFEGLLEEFSIGQLIYSTKNSFYQINEKVDLSFIQLDVNEGYVFQLDYLEQNYIDSLHWWKKGLIYQIIPSSYQDSNNDGWGDFNGLKQRLDYIQQLGVKTIWLTPFYKSPFKDLGYDISDFCSIDPRFGNFDDFKSLLDDIHRRQMKLIIDFVPNHCARDHRWFEAALRNEKPYVDYFIWHPGKNNDSSVPPTNWVGYAGQSMWTWAPERNQWYLHQFMDSQPDFNFRNEELCQEIENILQFWLDLGVDGFRADATRHLVENDQFKDEPIKENGENADLEVDYDAYEHTETADHPDNYRIIIRWRRFLDEYIRRNKRDYIILMTETQNKNVQSDMKYYGSNRWSRGNDLSINFFLAYFLGEKPEDRTGEGLAKFTQLWLENIPSDAWSTWILGSHDSKRVATKLADSNLIDGFFMLLLLLPGTPILYYGDEIGMENLQFTKELRDQMNDLSAFNYGKNHPEKIEEKTRDGQRTPMQWTSDQSYAGFTNASKPYHPLSKSWKTINVQNQLNSSSSHLKLFKELIQLRENPPFYTGKFQLVLASKDIYSFIRYSTKPKLSPVYLVIINMVGAGRNDMEDQCVTLNLIELLKCKKKDAKGMIIIRSCNIKENSSLQNDEDLIHLEKISLFSSESVVLKLDLTINDIHVI